MQVDRQALLLRRAQRDVPVIERAQVGLDILRPHLQVMALMLLVSRAHISDRHEEDIDEHCQNRRENDIHNTRGEVHVTYAAVIDQADDQA